MKYTWISLSYLVLLASNSFRKLKRPLVTRYFNEYRILCCENITPSFSGCLVIHFMNNGTRMCERRQRLICCGNYNIWKLTSSENRKRLPMVVLTCTTLLLYATFPQKGSTSPLIYIIKTWAIWNRGQIPLSGVMKVSVDVYGNLRYYYKWIESFTPVIQLSQVQLNRIQCIL